VEVAARCRDAELHALFLAWLGYARFHLGDLRASLEALERAGELATACDGKRAIAYAHAWRAIVLHAMGRTSEALRALRVAHALAPLFPEAGNYLQCETLLNLGMATANAGDLRQTRRIGEELIGFGESSGNSRAIVLGNLCLAYRHLAAGEFEAASAAASLAAGRAEEPHLRNLVLTLLSLANASTQDFAAARAVADRVLADTVSKGAESIATPARAAAALASLGEGRLSAGMKKLLELREDAARRGAHYDRTWIEVVIAGVYARIARREVPVPLMALLRNPGFVFRHALSARRKARVRLEQSIRECERGEIRSHEGAVHLELAALLVRSDPSGARSHLEQAIAILERQDAQAALGRARQIAATLGIGAS
jgi:tetratricopeptide (TPR) repeat protein